MAVSLRKGANLSLSSEDPGLKEILIGLGWNARVTSGSQFDLDASAFLVGENGKVKKDNDFIYYNKLSSDCGSVVHTGDNRTGDGDGDDESIKIYLEKIPADIKKVIICVTIEDAESRKQNFGQVEDSYMRVVNLISDNEIARFDLSEDYSVETAMVFGEIYKNNNEWKFKAIGQGFSGGLLEMCNIYGVNVA